MEKKQPVVVKEEKKTQEHVRILRHDVLKLTKWEVVGDAFFEAYIQCVAADDKLAVMAAIKDQYENPEFDPQDLKKMEFDLAANTFHYGSPYESDGMYDEHGEPVADGFIIEVFYRPGKLVQVKE